MSVLKWLSLALFAVLAACQTVPDTVETSGKTYLVRHAEKTAERPDPGLTDAGSIRAVMLADELEDVGLTAIWSTDYKRTRDTAAPIAARLGLEVQLYDPADLPGFAAQLKTDPAQVALVVGHSNTTPQLTEALGGDPATPIDEGHEYDRLYVVDLISGQSELRRYGVRYTPESADAPSQ